MDYTYYRRIGKYINREIEPISQIFYIRKMRIWEVKVCNGQEAPNLLLKTYGQNLKNEI